MSKEMSVQEMLANVIAGAGTATAPAKKDAPFTSYTVYINEHYIGNFSLPNNFPEGTKTAVMTALRAKGLELRDPGTNVRELSLADLGVEA